MPENSYYLVDSEVLPDTFKKVALAKEYIASGSVSSASEAARLAGISRSAFYKYKDFVHVYSGQGALKTITLSVVLKDKPGVLSALIATIFESGGNILTVNQSIPSGGYAAVSVSLRVDALKMTIDEFISHIKEVDGVKKIDNILGKQ